MPDPQPKPDSRRQSRLIPAIVEAARTFLDRHPAHAVAVLLGVPLIFAITLSVLALGAPELTRDVAARMQKSSAAMTESSETITEAVDEVRLAIDSLRTSIDANTSEINLLWQVVRAGEESGTPTDLWRKLLARHEAESGTTGDE